MFSYDSVKGSNERRLDSLDVPYPGCTEMCLATESSGLPTVYRKPSL